jgi:methionyl aminopeptidase
MSRTLERTTQNSTDTELNTILETDQYDGIDFMSHSSDSTWRFDFSNAKNVFRSNNLDDIDNGVFVKCDENINTANTTDKSYLQESDLADFRRASLIHKLVRQEARQYLYSGAKLADLVDNVESMILRLTKQDPNTYYRDGSKKDYDAGIAFPVGVNINNVVAHDSKTMTIEDGRRFSLGDVVKVDIGVHINGRIIDSAFTHIISSKKGVSDPDSYYNSVLEASRDSMFSTIKLAGPDQSLLELSENIFEIIESYEVDIAGQSIPVRAVNGIGGHNILQHQIHGGKLILCIPDEKLQENLRMTEDEVYAIETYATTGLGQVTQNDSMSHCTHFMEMDKASVKSNKYITKKDKKHFKKLPFYDWLQTRNGLPFSNSWLNSESNIKINKLEKAFKHGISTGQMVAYPPLNDEPGSVVAQFEHTIHLGSNNTDTVEIFSLGKDY